MTASLAGREWLGGAAGALRYAGVFTITGGHASTDVYRLIVEVKSR